MLELLVSAEDDAAVEELIDRHLGSTDHMRLRRNTHKNDYSINGLLQILQNASRRDKLDENLVNHLLIYILSTFINKAGQKYVYVEETVQPTKSLSLKVICEKVKFQPMFLQ